MVNDDATGLQWSYCLVGQTLNADQINCDGQPVVPYDVTPVEQYKPNIRAKVLDALFSEKQNSVQRVPVGVYLIPKSY